MLIEAAEGGCLEDAPRRCWSTRPGKMGIEIVDFPSYKMVIFP